VIVSKGRDPASKLVNEWCRSGTAAGLDGVYYDNRDRKHSDLGISTYPQLQPITYSADEWNRKVDWGKQLRAHPGKVVIGNSSTASPANQAGSHQRMYYLHPKGLSFLYQQYRSSALYVYPEHRDHDPGTNGPDGYGDLYPANSPYLICSQGSSGSDKAFMHAFLKTIAAFPPQTRDLLKERGLLMPTLQAIFRRTYRAVKSPADYFTGTAHPSAFDGRLIDEVAMVKQANAMTVETIGKMRATAGTTQPARSKIIELYHIHQFHLDLLSDVIVPTFLKRPPRVNYADPRLTTAKQWRDVYRYGKDESIAGWTRFGNGEKSEYDADGKLVVGGRSVAVRYVFDPQSKQLKVEPETGP
jgi:hypothetical protein